MNTKQLRQKILDLAIRGKLVPQDPNDEPASVLLERVRAEKERLIKEGKIKRGKGDLVIAKCDYSYYANLPDSWAVARLSSICSLLTDGTHQTPTYSKEGYVFLSSKNVTSGKIDWDNVMYIPQELHEVLYNRVAPELGDILLAKNGTTGFAAVVDRDCVFDIYVSLAIIRTFKKEILPKYLLYAISSENIQEHFRGNLKGIGVPNLHLEHIRSAIVPLPPLAEQHRIVASIESAFTLIDEIERNKNDLQTAVTVAKQKILSLAICGKLVPQDPDDEPAAVLLERIRTERERLIKAGKVKKEKPLVPVTEKEIPFVVPDGWVWCRLDDIGMTNIGLTYKPTDIIDNGVPVLRSNNIKNGRLDFSDLVRVNTPINESLELNEGDILICARNGSRHLVGKCALVQNKRERLTFGAFMAVYRSICNHYVYYFLNTDAFRSIFQSKGISTQINQLTQAMIKQTLLPLPPLAEQQRIVTAIEAAFEQLDRIVEMCK